MIIKIHININHNNIIINNINSRLKIDKELIKLLIKYLNYQKLHMII